MRSSGRSFKGADHAFLWKPKLRIPDIYENAENQRAFGRFLDRCACCSTEAQIVDAIFDLDRPRIKGLGPAAANFLYFLHPTLVSPFNTAIVKGYDSLAGAKVKLGSWQDYLAMRNGVLRLNAEYRDVLSNDLGAIAGLLFDVGSDRYTAPPTTNSPDEVESWARDLAAVSARAERERPVSRDDDTDRTHTEVQGWLRSIGRGLGYDVWIASNDRSRSFEDARLGEGCIDSLLMLDGTHGLDAVRLIDVLGLEKVGGHIVAAFEVEHTTSISSGIVRMLDLAMSPLRYLVIGNLSGGARQP